MSKSIQEISRNVQEICEKFIANRDALKAAAPIESSHIYTAAANMLTAAGVTADAAKLKECKKTMKNKISSFSHLRGTTELTFIAALYLSKDAEAAAVKIDKIYTALKREFSRSEYLALLAVILSGITDENACGEIAARGKKLFSMMKREHPFLTSYNDNVMAGFMALSKKSDDALIKDCEECYKILKRKFSDGQTIQTCSHILSLVEDNPAEKTEKTIELFQALRNAGLKYGKNYELIVLTSLALADADVDFIVETVSEFDGLLKKQKGYGALSCGTSERLTHAAMLSNIIYDDTTHGVSIPAASLAMLAASMAEADAVVAASIVTG